MPLAIFLTSSQIHPYKIEKPSLLENDIVELEIGGFWKLLKKSTSSDPARNSKQRTCPLALGSMQNWRHFLIDVQHGAIWEVV